MTSEPQHTAIDDHPNRSPTTGDLAGGPAGRTMRAVVQDRYGLVDALRLARITLPKIAEDELLLQVHAAGLDRGTWHVLTGRPYLIRLLGFGPRRPKNPQPDARQPDAWEYGEPHQRIKEYGAAGSRLPRTEDRRRRCLLTLKAGIPPQWKDRRMRALQFTTYGGPEVLRWGDAPDPHAGPGQIRITVRAASVNPIDWKAFGGAMSGGRPMAGTGYLGHDAAGVVDEVGEGVTGVSVGDDVFGLGRNAQAEYVVLNSWAAKPSSIDWAVAAAAGLSGETAERGLRLLDVKAGDTLFVDGGAGGVGAAVVQMAIARGATVIASSSEANHDYLREIGAIPVLYGDGLVARVQAAAVTPVDEVFDVAGKTSVEDLISLAPAPSQVLTIANSAAGQAGARVTGGGADSRPMEALAQVAELLVQNKLVIKIQTFPFDRAAEAYRISQNGHLRGKLVLVP